MLSYAPLAHDGAILTMVQQRVGRKGVVITELYGMCKSRRNFVFSNKDVKVVSAKVGFSNQYDVTKLDSTAKLPDMLAADDVFVVHLGRGMHKFVHGIDVGYHKFEAVSANDRFQWYYRPGILDNTNTSESNILSVGYNQRIIHDFLYRDITASPKAYGAHRTFITFGYSIGDDVIQCNRLQLEIDLTTEFQGRITIFEAKNGEPHDFNIFQLFHPYRYYVDKLDNLQADSIECCYLLRHDKEIRLYLYTFKDPNDPGSVVLRRNAEYVLVER